jgi:hypothetical protein
MRLSSQRENNLKRNVLNQGKNLFPASECWLLASGFWPLVTG